MFRWGVASCEMGMSITQEKASAALGNFRFASLPARVQRARAGASPRGRLLRPPQPPQNWAPEEAAAMPGCWADLCAANNQSGYRNPVAFPGLLRPRWQAV